MATLSVFNTISLDGYFTGEGGDLEWAHADSNDTEWNEFVSGNASGDGALLFGRVTYEMMASYWPTPLAMETMPAVAEGMNRMRKYVASRTIEQPAWSNTTVLRGDLAEEVRKLKETSNENMVVLGSGSVVAQLMQAGLIDEVQVVVAPVVLGRGRTMFEGVSAVRLKQTSTRTFRNGKVFIRYVPAEK